MLVFREQLLAIALDLAKKVVNTALSLKDVKRVPFGNANGV